MTPASSLLALRSEIYSTCAWGLEFKASESSAGYGGSPIGSAQYSPNLGWSISVTFGSTLAGSARVKATSTSNQTYTLELANAAPGGNPNMKFTFALDSFNVSTYWRYV